MSNNTSKIVTELTEWAEYWSKPQKGYDSETDKGWRFAAQEVLQMIKRQPEEPSDSFTSTAHDLSRAEHETTQSHEVSCICGAYRFDARGNATMAHIGKTMHRKHDPCYQVDSSVDAEWEWAKDAMAGESRQETTQKPRACECLIIDKTPSAYHAPQCPAYDPELL